MRYSLDIFQWDLTGCCRTEIFRDLDPEAFIQHSGLGHFTLLQELAVPWVQRSPAKCYVELNFEPGGARPWMQPNAFRYVFCAINKARRGKKMFLQLPEDFSLAVQVHQVLLVLQVEECIGPLHGHIRQMIKERVLSVIEVEVVWSCLRYLAPRVYEFALEMQWERETQNWTMRFMTKETGETDDMATDAVNKTDGQTEEVQDVAESSGTETVVATPEDSDMTSDDSSQVLTDNSSDSSRDDEDDDDDEGYDTDVEDNSYDFEEPQEQIEGEVREVGDRTLLTTMPRRSFSEPLPLPLVRPVYDISSGAFRECEDEEPEY
ncbi:hypothetical protein E4T42_04755 [Aureobasidium subglaciale]|nr:hypothetical protein E4T42_04755 [Aureobasidium subglaciale]